MADEYTIDNWAAIFGRWSFPSKTKAEFVAPDQNQRPFGLCVSNVRFSEGEIRLAIKTDRQAEVDGRILLGYRSPTDDYIAIGLGGYGNAYTLTHFNLHRGWTRIIGAGQSANLQLNQTYELCIKVVGKRVTLEVDGVAIFNHELELPIPYGQIGLFAWGEGGVQFSNVRIVRHPSNIEHVIVLIHGIRTFADWQTMLHREFAQVGIAVAPTNYGRLDLLKFLLPISSFKRAAIDRVWDLVRSVRNDYPNAKISFIAHSFGTYIIAEILRRDVTFRAHRIVFCGSVVRDNFPIEQYTTRFSPPLVNEVSGRDPWPLLAEKLGFGYGSVGTRGFKNYNVRDRWHTGYGHSQYLTNTFCRTFWLTLFSKDEVVESDSDPEPPKLWLRFLLLFASKWLIVAVILLLGLAWHFLWFSTEPVTVNQVECHAFRSSTAKVWRERNLLSDKPETYYVIVRSVSELNKIPIANRVVSWLSARELRQRFPEIDFDWMLSSSPLGENRMGAIVIARGLPEKSQACQIRNLARLCGIAKDAYIYRLGRGPEGCQSGSR